MLRTSSLAYAIAALVAWSCSATPNGPQNLGNAVAPASCPAGQTMLSAEECQTKCKGDKDFQDLLACPWKEPDGKCTDVSSLAPTCAPFSGECVCEAVKAMKCCLAADGKVALSAASVKFHDLQVVSAFPAHVDAKAGTSKRYCGTPLGPGQAVLPNGFEFTVNLVSTDLGNQTACSGDSDLSIHDGEAVEFRPVSADPKLGATVAPAEFKLAADCMEPRNGIGDPAACAGSLVKLESAAQTVHYQQSARRCDPLKTDSWQNVVILVDHSGSTSGQVVIDAPSCLDASKYAEDMPATMKPPEQFGKCASDKYFIRVQAAQQLLDQLNEQDRVMTLFFDEQSGVQVGCSDSMRCRSTDGTSVQAGKESDVCLSDADCDVASGYTCQAGDSVNSTFSQLDPKTAMQKCFGSSKVTKAYNRYGIDMNARYNGVGRAPLVQAVHTAYTFLRDAVPPTDSANPGNAKHIVLIADGPDTCAPSEDFHFGDPKAEFAGKVGSCRSPCAVSTTKYSELLAEMAAQGFPVKVHVIQLQSKDHRDPDPTLMELACRSDGTYQFLNQVEYVQDNPDQFFMSIGNAVQRVRYALAGSWRVGVQDNRVAIGDPSSPMPLGQVMAMRGALKFESAHFPSLAQLNTPPAGVADWTPGFEFRQGGSNGLTDRRLMFNLSCSFHGDCAGGADCAANHCAAGGVCKGGNAPDGLPCGETGSQVCCSGACSATCAKTCK